jgi:hypothetical protein
MRSASVSDPGEGRNTLPQAFGVALAVGLVAVLAVSVRILTFEEPASDRTLLLLMIAAEGGIAATLPVAVLALWIAGSWNRLLRAALGGLAVGGLFIPATLFFFALKIRVIDGRVEADTVTDLRLGDIFWSMFGAMGMFTPTGLRYLAPWPVMAVALSAALALFFWPRAAFPERPRSLPA